MRTPVRWRRCRAVGDGSRASLGAGDKTAGVFRVAPEASALVRLSLSLSSARARLTPWLPQTAYRRAFEEHRFEAEPADAHVVAALLMAYLDELPAPLISKSVFNALVTSVVRSSLLASCRCVNERAGRSTRWRWRATANRARRACCRRSFDSTNIVSASWPRCVKTHRRPTTLSSASRQVLVDVASVAANDKVQYSKMPLDKLAPIFAPLVRLCDFSKQNSHILCFRFVVDCTCPTRSAKLHL